MSKATPDVRGFTQLSRLRYTVPPTPLLTFLAESRGVLMALLRSLSPTLVVSASSETPLSQSLVLGRQRVWSRLASGELGGVEMRSSSSVEWRVGL